MRAFAILPAAGRSQRMGRPKLLLPWGKSTLIEHVIGTWRASRVDHVIVVLHPQDEELARLCRGAFTVAYEPPPAEMKDSIRYGLRAVQEVFHATSDDVWLVAPADMPALSANVVNAVIDAYQNNGMDRRFQPRIWAAQHHGRRGHPVLFPWLFAADVDTLGPTEGLKTLLERYPVVDVEVDSAGIFADVDTPEDYERCRPDSSSEGSP